MKSDQASGACAAGIPTGELGGRWEHCSPDLLRAGIDCSSTLRRPCECKHGGAHDHFISGDRLEMEAFDAAGSRVQWAIGPTQTELAAAHAEGRCDALCSYCITEAEELLRPDANVTEVATAQGCKPGSVQGLVPLAPIPARLDTAETSIGAPLAPNKDVKTCPVCLRAIAVVRGKIAHHGYRRTEQGWQTASCPGVRFKPLEVSSEGLEWLMATLRERRMQLAEAYANRATQPEFLTAKRKDNGPEVITRDDPFWQHVFARHVAELEGEIKALNREIQVLEDMLANWKLEA